MPQEWYRTRRAAGSDLSTTEKARILVVDPDEDTRTMYREWFQLNGCEMVEATDGRDGLTEALIRPPALVISEIRLPFIDGCALCEILRRDPATRLVPILIVTSEARTAELTRAKIAGASAILLKPAMPEKMLAETQRLLGGTPDSPDVTTQSAVDADGAPPRTGQRRLSKSLARLSTTTPPLAPPTAICPSCDRRLTYQRSHVGGVNERQPEQWDWFVCPSSCGTFEYRHRTRSLRRLVATAYTDEGRRRPA
jgi:two-component system chemotaxis response regulator CheY